VEPFLPFFFAMADANARLPTRKTSRRLAGMPEQPWDPIADTYAELRDARLHTVFPHAIALLQQRGVSRLLDYGGGPGLFLAQWLQRGGTSATHFDPSPEMRANAAQRLASPIADGAVTLVTDPGTLPTEAFDAVTFHAVWMCLSSREECVAVLREIHRLLRPGGVLLASVTHPCFRDRPFSTFRPALPMERYLDEGTPFKVVMHDAEHAVEITDYHYSLGEHVRQLVTAGFQIAALHEYLDLPREPRSTAYPWLMFEAAK